METRPMTTAEMEIAIAYFFDIRRNLIVPNVSWAIPDLHECDLFVLTKAGYAYEIEIKTSIQDLKRDMIKRHNHFHKYIRRLYFAIPRDIQADISLFPVHAGILSVNKLEVEIIRQAKPFMSAKLVPDHYRQKLYHLCAMRLWNLKVKANNQEKVGVKGE